MVREYQETPENDLYEKQFNCGKKYNEDTVTYKEKNKMEIIQIISKQLHIQ
jgi:hypothetical protein